MAGPTLCLAISQRSAAFLVVAFRREQQALVDEWLAWLIDPEQPQSDVEVYKLPVLSS